MAILFNVKEFTVPYLPKEETGDGIEQINYPAKQDIYNQRQRVDDADIEGLDNLIEPTQNEVTTVEDEMKNESRNNDLDITNLQDDNPTSLSIIEDEENNFYSLGG